MELAVFTVIRLLIPLTILRFPLFGFLASIIADAADYDRIGLGVLIGENDYQIWDKVLDTYFLAIATLVVWKLTDRLTRNTAVVLLAWRLLGVAVFNLTGIRQVLLFFPNILESFLVFVFAFIFFTHKKSVFSSRTDLFITLIILSVPKIIQEYFWHFQKNIPLQTYPFNFSSCDLTQTI